MSWSPARPPLAGPARQGDASTVQGPGAPQPMAELPRPLASLRYPPIGGAEGRFDTPSAVVVRRPAVIPERYSTREKDGTRSARVRRGAADPRDHRPGHGGLAVGCVLPGGTRDPARRGRHVRPAGRRRPQGLQPRPPLGLRAPVHARDLRAGAAAGAQRAAAGPRTTGRSTPTIPTSTRCSGLWCLLNHRRLRELRPEARDVLLPILRLEGAIDANGPELAKLCGLPTRALADAQRRIDELLVRERELKQAGAWTKKDGVRLHDRDAALDRRAGLPVRGLRRLHADRGDLRPRRDRAAPGGRGVPRPLGHLHRRAAPEDPLGRSALA